MSDIFIYGFDYLGVCLVLSIGVGKFIYFGTGDE